MSADNHIVIDENIDGLFRGYVRFIEGDYSNIDDTPIFEVTSLVAAIEAANKYMSENMVEYGYTFDLLPSTDITEQKGVEIKYGIPITLEPGKIYCLSVSNSSYENFLDTMDTQLENLAKKHNIHFLILLEGIEVVSIPKGYKMVKENKGD